MLRLKKERRSRADQSLVSCPNVESPPNLWNRLGISTSGGAEQILTNSVVHTEGGKEMVFGSRGIKGERNSGDSRTYCKGTAGRGERKDQEKRRKASRPKPKRRGKSAVIRAPWTAV